MGGVVQWLKVRSRNGGSLNKEWAISQNPLCPRAKHFRESSHHGPEEFVCLTRSACRIEKQTALTEALWVIFSSKPHELIITYEIWIGKWIKISTILKKAWRSWNEKKSKANKPVYLSVSKKICSKPIKFLHVAATIPWKSYSIKWIIQRLLIKHLQKRKAKAKCEDNCIGKDKLTNEWSSAHIYQWKKKKNAYFGGK